MAGRVIPEKTKPRLEEFVKMKVNRRVASGKIHSYYAEMMCRFITSDVHHPSDVSVIIVWSLSDRTGVNSCDFIIFETSCVACFLRPIIFQYIVTI